MIPKTTMRRIERETYLRLVPSARNNSLPSRAAWGVGEHIIFLGRDPERVTQARAFIDENQLEAYLQADVPGVFVEFHDASAAMLFWLRFR